MLGWDQYGFLKKRVRTHYIELVFLDPMGSARHIMQSGVSGARNINTLFFLLGWARCCFHKKSTGSNYAELVFLLSVGSVGHVVYYGASRA
jgi:hypothetical protein